MMTVGWGEHGGLGEPNRTPWATREGFLEVAIIYMGTCQTGRFMTAEAPFVLVISMSPAWCLGHCMHPKHAH